MKTGKDEWGKFMPLHFKSFGEYKLPMQIYFSIPAIYLFGLTPFAVRIFPVVYGVLSVLLLYLLTKKLFKNEVVAQITAFLMAVSPWHIQLTRASFESSFALMWLLTGIYLLVYGFEDKKKKIYWLISVIPLSFAIYTYNSARGFIPIFLVILVVFYFKELRKNLRTLIISMFAFSVIMIPLGLFVLSGEGSARYKLVSVTDEPGLIPRIEEQRNLSTLSPLATKLIHNRYTYVTVRVFKNYFAHFSPVYLFVKGAIHVQHHPQEIGELYVIQAPFLLLGIFFLIKKKNKYKKLLGAWFFTAHIPVAFTIDSIPQALRTLNANPVYQIVTALGIYFFFFEVIKKKKLLTYLLGVMAFSIFAIQFIGYQHYLYKIYPVLYSRDWQYGNKQAVEYISQNYDKYDLIVYTREYGEPHIFTLFYLNYPPEKYYDNQNLDRYETHDWIRVLRFDKFYFPDLGDDGTTAIDVAKDYTSLNILFIATPTETPPDVKILKTIDFLDGERAFNIFSNR